MKWIILFDETVAIFFFIWSVSIYVSFYWNSAYAMCLKIQKNLLLHMCKNKILETRVPYKVINIGSLHKADKNVFSLRHVRKKYTI